MFSNKDYVDSCEFTFNAQKKINDIFSREIAVHCGEKYCLTDRSIVSWVNPITGNYHRKCLKSFTKWVLRYGFITRESDRISADPFFSDTGFENYNIAVFQNVICQLAVCH